jgi:hypothetical protein
MQENYNGPEYEKESFTCPFCNIYSQQDWFFTQDNRIVISPRKNFIPKIVDFCRCTHCDNISIWADGVMIFPRVSIIELPNTYLSDDIKSDYNEAAKIFMDSPRGSAALLRLALQKLCIQLGEEGSNLNIDIGNLVKKGLPTTVQKSFDILRVIGNEAVHPGLLDLKDDAETSKSLFRLINFIAERMIEEEEKINEIYSSLPDTKKEQIEKRDSHDK